MPYLTIARSYFLSNNSLYLLLTFFISISMKQPPNKYEKYISLPFYLLYFVNILQFVFFICTFDKFAQHQFDRHISERFTEQTQYFISYSPFYQYIYWKFYWICLNLCIHLICGTKWVLLIEMLFSFCFCQNDNIALGLLNKKKHHNLLKYSKEFLEFSSIELSLYGSARSYRLIYRPFASTAFR